MTRRILPALANGLELAFRPAVYRYRPTGLGARVGVGLSGTRSLWRGGGVRVAAEGFYRVGEYDHPESSFTGVAYGGQGEIALTQRLPLLGTVTVHPRVGVYGEMEAIVDASAAPNANQFEGTEGQGGIVASLPVQFKLVDARVSLAPVVRYPLVQTGRLPVFEGTPGAGIWIDF